MREAPQEGEVIARFIEAMQAAGYSPPRIDTNLNDFERFDAPGDKKGRRNGYYKLLTGEYPIGWFGDWKTGEQIQWEYHERGALSSREVKKLEAEHRRLKAEAQREREAVWRERAADAQKMWKEGSGDVAGHPYLVRKGIDTPKGLRLRVAGDGTQLIMVPMWRFDMNGKPQLQNLQFIAPDGSKRYMKGARKDDCFFSLRGDVDHQIAVIAEGLATGFTIWKATGLSVFVAFDGGNLVRVARELELWRAPLDKLVAGDDDVVPPDDWEERGRGKAWVNAGRKGAEKAARACKSKFVMPSFAEGPARGRTDFNDLEFCDGIEAVRAQIWGALGYGGVTTDDETGEQVAAKLPDEVIDETWRNEVPRLSSGNPDGGNIVGVRLFIANHRRLKGRLRYNLFSRAVEVDGEPLEGHHINAFRDVMHMDLLKAKVPDVAAQMDAEARRNPYDPLIEYLGSVLWDGELRLDNWLQTYLGSPDTDYNKAVGPRILIGAVARAYQPGCKLDTMPILEGDQGIGKSTAIRFLFGDEFFIDDVSDFTSKDTFQLIQGAWCCEIAEMAALNKSEVSEVKKFLTKTSDKYRAPYERTPIQVARRTIFIGSVNPEQGIGYLRDTTGARRFWPIKCGNVSLRAIQRDRDQLWAEARARFERGAKWHLDDPVAVGLAQVEQHKRREVDAWEEKISNWLWGRTTTTISEVMIDCLGVPTDRQNTQTSRRIGGVLRSIGWEAFKERDGKRVVTRFYAPSGTSTRVDSDLAWD